VGSAEPKVQEDSGEYKESGERIGKAGNVGYCFSLNRMDEEY